MMKSYKILIVDNDLITANHIKNYLNSYGFDVLGIVSNHKDAISFLETKRVDILLLDIAINGSIDGIQCCDIVYKKYKIPSIFITSYYDKDVLFSIENSKSYGYILKPFKNEVLRVNIMLILAKLNKNIKPIINTTKIHLQNEYSFCTNKKVLYHRNIEIDLTKKEKKVIEILTKNKNSNISYELLFNYVWDKNDFCINKIRGSIFRLKKKVPDLVLSNNQDLGYKIQ